MKIFSTLTGAIALTAWTAFVWVYADASMIGALWIIGDAAISILTVDAEASNGRI